MSHRAEMIAAIYSVCSFRVSAVKEELARTLKPFMIPEFVVRLPQIPLNTNGKPDAAKLPVVGGVCLYQELPSPDNPSGGCAHSCRYCYASFMKRFTKHPEPWGEFVDV